MKNRVFGLCIALLWGIGFMNTEHPWMGLCMGLCMGTVFGLFETGRKEDGDPAAAGTERGDRK